MNTDGTVTGPTYNINRVEQDGKLSLQTYDNVGDALGGISYSLENLAEETKNEYANTKYFRANSTAAGAAANRIEDVARNAYAGVAAAMATQMPGTYVPGKTVMRVGSAVFKGEPAVGVSFRRTSENNGWSVTGGVGMSRAGVAATVGAEWVFN